MNTTALPSWFYQSVSWPPRPRVVNIPTPFFERRPTWWPK